MPASENLHLRPHNGTLFDEVTDGSPPQVKLLRASGCDRTGGRKNTAQQCSIRRTNRIPHRPSQRDNFAKINLQTECDQLNSFFARSIGRYPVVGQSLSSGTRHKKQSPV